MGIQDWPELARVGFQQVLNFQISNGVNAVLNRFSENSLAVKAVFEKIDRIFTKVLNVPGEVIRDDYFTETDDSIKLRFWVLFFQSFASAASMHNPKYEYDSTAYDNYLTEYDSYLSKLAETAEQTKQLIQNLKIIQNYRNKSVHTANLRRDPAFLLLKSLENNNKYFDNPFYDELEAISRRYDRHQPEIEQVLGVLQDSIVQSCCDERVAIRHKKVPGLIETLIDRFQWNENDRSLGYLPRHFISSISGANLAILINIAWVLEPAIEKGAVEKARRILLNT